MPLQRTIRRLIPAGLRSRVKTTLARVRGLSNFYERIYDRQAALLPPEESIGTGDYDLIGRIELGLLLLEGTRPSDTVIDLGCGTGRLAVHLIPYLHSGRYVGIDISRNMLRDAGRRTRGLAQGRAIAWKHQRTSRFDLPDASADMLCAFSVFTHMEAEDTYRYLADALRVVRPGGKLVFSCLPLSLAESRRIFLEQAKLDLAERWAGVRNFVTTEEAMEALAGLAGWKPLRWHRGDQASVPVQGLPPQALGQSTCVLERPASLS